ncbi:hypothetical protein HF882_10725 [Victivallis vadensis]|uniref:Rhamnogalacturonase A/B/Epimerase-like pectate lyase domain-containing protein n=1 Tax=Victivallis vadensis TaxID=172901 RepID=A0A848B0K2_9BACT|nr:glycosyl hydrolase family 28 protein [Victivallis vadensis]NMD87059.1 hypothetical protein [Victivallis vadensis]
MTHIKIVLLLAILPLAFHPTFAGFMRNVRDFGAAGDGKTKDTAAIQKAIDAGGIIHFPPGIYLSGTLYLKSNGGLDLAPGALLLASPDRADYNDDKFCPQNQTNYSPSEQVSGAHFIVAVGQHDIVIRGGGTISGNQSAFYRAFDKVGPRMGWTANKLLQGWRPSQMVYITESDRVTVHDVRLIDPPYWTLYLFGCRDVAVDRVRIDMPFFSRNGDGISIDSCRNVTVANCNITSGDDALVIRSCDFRLPRPQPLENVVINNCILNTFCYGVRVGVGDAPIRNVQISNIICRARIAVWVGPYFGREKLIEDCVFSNWLIDAEQGIRIVPRPLKRPAETLAIRNLVFRNFSGTVALAAEMMPNIPCSNIQLSNFNLRLRKVDRNRCYYEKDPVWRAPFIAAGIDKLRLDNIRLIWENPESSFTRPTVIRCPGAQIRDCDFGGAPMSSTPSGHGETIRRNEKQK